jgi:long-chain acyl-CoA synthetase
MPPNRQKSNAMSRSERGVISASGFRPFDALERRARRVASGLDALGVGPGACVALLTRNDTPFLEVSYAVMRLGGYAVPLNWHFKAEEIAYVLADCGARALFAHEDLLARIADALPLKSTCSPWFRRQGRCTPTASRR